MEGFENVLEETKGLLSLLWDAFDVSCQTVQAFFKDTNIDPYLAPNLLRYHTKQYIISNRWKVDGLQVENVANNGLSIYYGKYHLRIWKDQGTELPDPGLSSIKEDFLRQRHMFQPGLWEFDDQPENLAILWTMDSKYNLLKLRLAHPVYSIPGEEPLSADWSILLKRLLPDISSDYFVATEETQYDLQLGSEYEEEAGENGETNSGEEDIRGES